MSDSMVKGKLRPDLIFNKEKVTLLLAVNVEESAFHDVEKAAKQKRLLKKEEFHITIIGKETGETIIEKIKNTSPAKQEDILSKSQEASGSFNWDYSFQKKYYFISKKYVEPGQEKEERQSIIQLVTLPYLVPFYKRLNQFLGTNFDIPFPHITLFTNSTREDKKLRGIGLYSEKEFHALNPIKIE